MANNYSSTGQYTRYNRLLPGSSDGAFRGVDFSSEASLVDQTRLAFLRNMWRDYDSENGGCVETSPGYRLIRSVGEGTAHGLWEYRYNGEDYVISHMGTKLIAFKHSERDNGTADYTVISSALADEDSQAFVFGGKFYLLDGTTYWVMEGISSLQKAVSDEPYVPITYSDEEAYEQRNMLTDHFIEKWNVVDVKERLVTANYGVVLSLNPNTKTATVTGINSTRRVLYIPDTYVIDGVSYYNINIKAYAFNENSRLEKVVIMGCNNIEEFAFTNCPNLTTVVIHSFGVLAENAFNMNPKLSQVWLGGHREGGITAGAFYDCPGVNLHLTAGSKPSGVGVATGRIYTGCKLYAGFAGNAVEFSTTYADYPKASVVGNEGYYISGAIEPVSEDGKWSTQLLRARSLVTVTFYGGSQGAQYEAITVLDSNGSIFSEENDEETACAADFYILDPCKEIDKVTIQGALTDGKELEMKVWYNHNTSVTSGKTLPGVNCEVYKDENNYFTRVRLFADRPSLLENFVLKLYGEAEAGKFSTVGGLANYSSASGGYTGTGMAAINGCRICTIFDGRPFLTGNPNLPNTVFYCSRRSDTGTIDPTYVGVCSFFNDGTGNCPNSALLAAGSILMVLKGKSGAEGSVFYHSPRETGVDYLPKDYPTTEGASGYDCMGAALNFLDDYIFVTTAGVSAVDKQQLNLERTIGHRSSNIDRVLCKLDLSCARLCEWKGYLVLACEGYIFLADSRKMFKGTSGSYEYEWFMLTDIGYHKGQYSSYRTMTGGAIMGEDISRFRLMEDGTPTGKYLTVAAESREVSDYVTGEFLSDGGVESTMAYIPETMEAVSSYREYVGGVFTPARQVLTLGDVLYFAFDGGICCFNTDKRGINFCTFSDGSEELYISENGAMVKLLIKEDDSSVVQSGEVAIAYQKTTVGYRPFGEVQIYRESDRIYRLESPMNPVSRFEMDSYWYTYCGRSYRSEMATAFDDCRTPFLSKNTIHDSLVISAKVMQGSRFKVLCRTEREEWKTVEEISAGHATFTDLNFGAHSFRSRRELIYKSRERAKKWVKKQLCFSADCFRSPFGIYNLGYGYTIYGKVKI